MGRVATSHPHCLTLSKKLKCLSALDTFLLRPETLYFLRRKSRTRRRPQAFPFIPAYRSNVNGRSVIPGGRKDSSILPATSATEETTWSSDWSLRKSLCVFHVSSTAVGTVQKKKRQSLQRVSPALCSSSYQWRVAGTFPTLVVHRLQTPRGEALDLKAVERLDVRFLAIEYASTSWSPD